MDNSTLSPAEALNSDTILVTRHAGAMSWLRKQPGFDGNIEATAHLDPSKVRAGVKYVGVFPLPLACEICSAGGEVWAIAMQLPPELRGIELTEEQMNTCGAQLVRYSVQVIDTQA